MENSATKHLLGTAGTRLTLAALGRNFHRAFLALVIAAVCAVLAARLLGLLPSGWFSFTNLAAIPLIALAAAFAFLRRPTKHGVARAIDERTGSRDLFLTAVLMPAEPAGYQDIVSMQAEKRAAGVKARAILPLNWLPGTRDSLLAAGVLLALVQWLPQLDPFRMEEKRGESARNQTRLEETRKITAARRLELEQKGAALTEQVDKALAKLDKTLKEAKPDQREVNAKKLNEETQDFSELWKKAVAQLPKNAVENFERAAQSFGDADQRKAMKEMLEKLKKGDASALRQAMEKLHKDMQEIAKMPDGPGKNEKLEKLARELAKTASQLREQLGDKALNEALQRAIEQMELAREKGLTREAIEAAAESLKLSEEELKQLAQNFKDAANLEDALKNLAMAKQLNEHGKLDGKLAAGAGSQAEYEELYKKLMAQAGEGEGDGNEEGEGGDRRGRGKSGKNPGIGNGGTVGEDPDAKTALKDEKGKTKSGAGKLLMQWKEQGQGEVGTKAADYEAAVRAVKQGVAEAIRNEQIPPGYHGTIQKYFDKLPEKAGPR